MSHFQEIFIQNLRYFRKKRGFSQLKFSEMINVSPNYLNAIENGRNFPSVEVMQTMSEALEILPYQFFLECPGEAAPQVPEKTERFIQELILVRQKFISEIDEIIKKYGSGNSPRQFLS
jgi:transcriptional regulator with XRE-family HTH domain